MWRLLGWSLQPVTLVVEFMDDIIHFVADLIEKGYAYRDQGDIYFRVEKSHNYAKLANKTLEKT